MNDKLMLQVTVHYQGFQSALEIDLSEYNNDDSYLESIKDHINIAKQIIDTKIRNKMNDFPIHANKDHPLHKCVRCESKEISPWFKMMYGLHEWLLCNDCSEMFYEWVIDKQADSGCGWSKTHFKRKYGKSNNE